ncbi:30S ribosome-binding factor RbfA [Thermanaerothrix sp. 4228-RoL]|jgi:ribosome-binding factor A|uniref:Ribosome-binding factor A n=1 Tax=Thermanaerothrix solaris TaxID=3058434 RepID=A0ABU3NLY6_9CHLR|nr:30S ribosome-binding factor RbfA [Thermanaerothrix sp. 4228-RoL]MDT8897822.1 30S ribosome-binding factor RbfA [Thermanaerothrix sp. 4228-RoL]
MPTPQRLQRIAERIQEEISEMLVMGEIRDPRLSGVTITGVKVDREFAFADIYVSAVEGSQRAPEILEAFNHASGYIRRLLAERIELRVFPRLRFHWDPTPERADRIERLLASLRSGSTPSEASSSSSTPSAKSDDTDEAP